MRKYPAENWKLFGASVHDMRMRQGYRDTRAWCDAVGRSDRMLLGLERGEPVGPKTIEAIAKALGHDEGAGFLFTLLADGPDLERDSALFWERDHQAEYEDRVSRVVGDAIATLAGDSEDAQAVQEAIREMLSQFSNKELISEIAARLARSEHPLVSGEDVLASSTPVSELDHARALRGERDREELSEEDASLSPAADNVNPDDDEEPGGSDERD